jgi:TPR repeat protein
MLVRWSKRTHGSTRAIRFDVSDRFSDDELARAGNVGSRDPRLMVAVRDADHGSVTATLAGSDDLIDYWTGSSGDQSGQAVITAAVIARLCGHPDPIPIGVLEALALARLSAQRAAPEARNWLGAAIAWAATPLMGKISAIRAVRTKVEVVDGYNVSDILVQRWRDGGEQEMREAFDDDATWDLLLTHADPSVDVEIGGAAYYNNKLSIAERAWLSATDHGSTSAMHRLGLLYRNQGKAVEARRWLLHATDLGNHHAMVSLGGWFAERDEAAEAERWFRKAADLGDSFTMGALGFWLQGRGESAQTEAEQWYRKAADLGDPNSMANLGFILDKRGEVEKAEYWDRKAVDLGHVGAMQNLGDLLRDRGDNAEALAWYRRGAEQGYATAMHELRWLSRWPGEAGDEGLSNSIMAFANLLQEHGEVAEAEVWYRRTADLGDARAASRLAVLLEDRGEIAHAEEWQRKAADLAHANLQANKWSLLTAYGDSAVLEHTLIMLTLADWLAKRGEHAAAETWYQRAVGYGDVRARARLSALRIEQGGAPEADASHQLVTEHESIDRGMDKDREED